MCEGSFSGVSGNFKEVSRRSQECLEKVARVFQDSFKSVSRKIELYFKGIQSNFKGNKTQV